MNNPWTAWVKATTATEVGTSLAMFRILMGTFLLIDMLGMFTHDVLDPLYRPYSDGGLARDNVYYFTVGYLGGPSLELAESVVITGAILSAALMVGFGGRITAFLLLQTMLTFYSLPIDIGGGYDRLITNGLFLLVLGSNSATMSVDCWLRSRTWTSDKPIFGFARYLGIYQLVVMYTSTGFAKQGGGWVYPYDAVYLAFNRMPYSRFGIGWDGEIQILTRIGTFVAWWWEFSFFVLGLWFLARAAWMGSRLEGLAKRWDLRIPYIGIGLVMHLTLWVAMDLGTFTVISLSFYVLLYSPAEWHQFWQDAVGSRHDKHVRSAGTGSRPLPGR